MKTEYFDDGSGMIRRRQALRLIEDENVKDAKLDFFLLELVFWVINAAVASYFFTIEAVMLGLAYVFVFFVFAELAWLLSNTLFNTKKKLPNR